MGQTGDVVEFSLKRVMKTLNNFILNEYSKLFFNSSSGDAKIVKHTEVYTNAQLLKKAQEELKFCENKHISAE
jgi:hypothetical protein